MFDPIISYLFENHNAEVNYIRAEMHEEQQRLDREEIDKAEAWDRAIEKDMSRRDRREIERQEAEEQEAIWAQWIAKNGHLVEGELDGRVN
jgi:hypothetical protein